MSSCRVHRFSHLLGICAVLSLTGGCLTGCAAWFQGESAQAQINIGEADIIEAGQNELTIETLGDLSAFINTDRAAEMLITEPLQTRVASLVRNNQDWFNASREVLLQVTQIMQGYILSEGHSLTRDERSLVMIDTDRNALMVVLVDIPSKAYKVLGKNFESSDAQAAAEMEEYAETWALGQLGMAK